MPFEHSAGAVIYRKDNGQVKFLLLHYEEGHWGCAKGHTENGETIEQTARREIQEETGITDIRFIEGFKELNQYFFMSKGERINKTVTFLLVETATKEISISDEHTGFEWLPYAEALKRITFKAEKEMFTKAFQFLLNNNRIPSA
jgi:8-oxo-dGTP pyrophosphatase MutT (NUDIX family)